ncbi:hypothetical protein [Enterococcus sp. AZ196]|uniref:hypothetical protein n=1 Tax=Enterococcus sp. AZ196 TaxID=2774659 RepID=UPI003D2713FC
MKCVSCSRKPNEISEYVEIAKENDYRSADFAVRYEEGTYHYGYDLFCCTSCYIKMGMPLQNELNELYQKGCVSNGNEN